MSSAAPHKKVDDNPYKNIEEQVKVYLNGKHGRIGLIYPDEPITEEEWETLNREMAMIIYNGL